MRKVLLVAVTKAEVQAVLDVFSEATGHPWARKSIGNKIYYTLGDIGGVDVLLVQSEMGSGTPGGALITVHKAIEDLQPAAVILVGIAFGARPDKQQMGDILISKQLVAYEPGKLEGRNQFIPRGDRATCSLSLLDKFRTADLDWTGPTVHFGLILTGEKLIGDAAFRMQLLKLEPEAIGGEMEGAGLYTAAQFAKVDWILVKAICNWADSQKADNAQPQAAANAAEFVLHTLKIGAWTSSDQQRAIAAVNGPGVISQGNNNVTIGMGGIYVAGNVGGDIVTGKKVTQSQAQTSGALGKAISAAPEMARHPLEILEGRAATYTIRTKLLAFARLFRFELSFAAGVCAVLGEQLALGKLPSVSQVVFGFLSVFLLSATSLILNDYFDIESDKINAPDRPLPAGVVARRDVLALSGVVTVLGLITCMLLGFQALLAGLVVWIVGFLYNWRFKKMGLPGNLMVSFSVGMTFIFGGIVVGRPLEKMVWFFAIIAALINLGEEIAADAMDAAGDRQAGSRSLALLFGCERALKISAALFLLAIAVTSLFFLFGWLEWIYALPIVFMDGMILYATLKLLDGRTANRRIYIRWVYWSAMAALLAFLVVRILR